MNTAPLSSPSILPATKLNIAAYPAATGAGVPILHRAKSTPQTLNHRIYNQSNHDSSKNNNPIIKYRSLRIPMIPLATISQTNNAHALPLVPLVPPKMISVRQTSDLLNSQSRSRSISPVHVHDHNHHDDDQQQQHVSLRKLEKKLKRISVQMKLLEEVRDIVEDETESIIIPNVVVRVVSPSRGFSKRSSRNSVT
ncbi:hypothetical protein HK100_002979 [Physocladia obscura]|uniref:Uncharacterized protein n=1 Tax=Physocladia obscura TaxID=109957 RepID=A0AAD5XLA8_9FUNG|nr:hypothetical protein HK100_002979 [Physocladia obscura]